MTGHRWTRARLLTAGVVALCAVSACDSGGSDEPSAGGSSSAAAEPTDPAETQADVDAAAAYGKDLRAWSGQVSRAVRSMSARDFQTDRRGKLPDLLASPPVLAAATSDEPPAEYAVARQVSDRVGGIVDELSAYAARGTSLGAYYDAYDVFNVHQFAHLDLLSKASDLAFARVGSTTPPKVVLRQEVGLVDDDLALLSDYDAGLAKVEKKYADDPMQVSALDYQRAEVAWLTDLQEEHRAYLRAAGPRSTQPAYGTRATDAERYFTLASNTPIEDEPAVTRTLATYLDDLGTLAVAAPTELPEDAPSAGDAYRWRISETVAPTGLDDDRTAELLNDQLWRLYRLREIEQTPDEAFQAARDHLTLQVSADPRSPFETMIAVLNTLRSTYAGDEDPPTRDTIAWAEEQLATVTPPVLAPYRDQLLALLEKVEPIADDVMEIRPWDLLTARAEKILTRAANDLDRHGPLAEQIRTAVEDTRPEAS